MIPDKVYIQDGYSAPVVGFIGPAWDNSRDIENAVEYVRRDTLPDWSNADVREAAKVLVDSVEKYVRQETSRSTLLAMKDNLKKLLEK